MVEAASDSGTRGVERVAASVLWCGEHVQHEQRGYSEEPARHGSTEVRSEKTQDGWAWNEGYNKCCNK